MRKKVYEMTNKELYDFEDNLTFAQLDELEAKEVEILDQGIVKEVVSEENFTDIEDAISYKEMFGVELNEEEEDYLEWSHAVDDDLGLPLMSRETIATL